MTPDSKIYVAGHNGLVGSALVRELQGGGYFNIVTRTSRELDLRDQAGVRDYFEQERPEYVFMAAGKVGGILANDTYPVDFLRDNLQIQTSVIDSAYRSGVKKYLYLGSSCIYPRDCPQPIKEEYLLTSPLEKTNEWYAIAKISGVKMCQAYNRQYNFNAISVMPANLYGPGDNFDLNSSHVLPALMRKLHEAKVTAAKEVIVWGTGKPKREFLYVEDLANACLFLMQHYNEPDIINVGTGQDITIKELVETIREIVGCKSIVRFDTSKPDGTPRKLLDVSKMTRAGWQYKTSLADGIRQTYSWYIVAGQN